MRRIAFTHSRRSRGLHGAVRVRVVGDSSTVTQSRISLTPCSPDACVCACVWTNSNKSELPTHALIATVCSESHAWWDSLNDDDHFHFPSKCHEHIHRTPQTNNRARFSHLQWLYQVNHDCFRDRNSPSFEVLSTIISALAYMCFPFCPH